MTHETIPPTRTSIAADESRTPTPAISSEIENGGVEARETEPAAADAELVKALEKCDEAAIWKQYRDVSDKDRFLGSLGSLAGRYSTQQKHRHSSSTLRHHALFAVPFVLPARAWPCSQPPAGSDKAVAALCALLQKWLGYQQPVRVLGQSIRYEDLCNWSPLLQREYLQALEWRRSSCSRPAVRLAANLPDDWPRLAFVVGGVQKWKCLPQLTAAEVSDGEWQLRERLAAHLGYIHQRDVIAGQVLAPLFFPQAVLAGLKLWIGELFECGHVDRWDLHLHLEDYVVLELMRPGADAEKTLLPIRLHHLGVGGYLALSAGIAAVAGPPSHCTPPHS